MAASRTLRRALVAELEKRRRIRSPAVRRAFMATPREVFVADHVRRGGLEAVYKDVALVTKTDAKGGAISSSSQPTVMAVMLEAMQVRPGHRVLEIGAGTGYNAALLAHLAGNRGSVTAIDIDPELVARAQDALRAAGRDVTVVAGDGRMGHPAGAPYDRIIATASTDSIPRAWWEQLAPGGLLQVPLRLAESSSSLGQSIVVFERTTDGFVSVASNPGGFMGMRGTAGQEAPLLAGSVAVAAYEVKGYRAAATYAYVSGAPLRRATSKERRALLRAMLDEPRVTKIAGPAKRYALQAFLTLGVPGASLVQYAAGGYHGAGVCGPGLRSVAVAVGRGTGATSLRAYGTRDAERTLRAAIAQWRALGSPGDKDLRITVSFDGRPRGWRVLRRGEARIAVDWAR